MRNPAAISKFINRDGDKKITKEEIRKFAKTQKGWDSKNEVKKISNCGIFNELFNGVQEPLDAYEFYEQLAKVVNDADKAPELNFADKKDEAEYREYEKTAEEKVSERVKESESFKQQHEKLIQAGFNPNFYYYDPNNKKMSGYVSYSSGKNQVRLYARDAAKMEDLPDSAIFGTKTARGVDISKMELSPEQLLDLQIDDYTTMNDYQKGVFAAAKKNMSQMGCGIDKVSEKYSGCGTTVLLDRGFLPSDKFGGKVTKVDELCQKNWFDAWHSAAMMSVMHKVSPDSNIECRYGYGNGQALYDNLGKGLQAIMKDNENLNADETIHSICIGNGFIENDDVNYEKHMKIAKEAVDSGIFIMSTNTKELYGVTIMFADRNPQCDVNNPESYTKPAWASAEEYIKNDEFLGYSQSIIDKVIEQKKKNNPDEKPVTITEKDLQAIAETDKKAKEHLDKINSILHLPSMHFVVAHEDGKSEMYEGASGGVCWSLSMGSLYNNFLCIDENLKPQAFMDLLMETSDDFYVKGDDGTKYYAGRILNAERAMQVLEARVQKR